MKLPQDHQRLDSRELKINREMAEFAFGIRDRGFAQLGHDDGIALDANLQAVHVLRQLLQVVVSVIETFLILRVGMVIEPLVVQQDHQLAQRTMHFVNPGVGTKGGLKQDFGYRVKRRAMGTRNGG